MTSLSTAQPSAVLDQSPFLTQHSLNPVCPASAQDLPYLVVCPELFYETISSNLKLVDRVPLRESGKHYDESSETNWPEYPNAYTAQVWQAHVNSEKVIYLPHNGRLYRRSDIFETARLIVHLLQEEESTVVSRSGRVA